MWSLRIKLTQRKAEQRRTEIEIRFLNDIFSATGTSFI